MLPRYMRQLPAFTSLTQTCCKRTRYYEPMATRATDSQMLTVGPLEVFEDQDLARVDGRAVVLSGYAFGLLVALARRPGMIVDRDVLYREVWGATLQPGDRSVDATLFKLRGALEQAGPGWRFIHTHHNRGYRLAPKLRSPRAVPVGANVVVPHTPGTRIIVGHVEIVPPELLVIVGDDDFSVRPRDMDVLALLATNAGRVLSRDAIFEAIWNRPLDPHDRSVDVSIGRLRTRFSDIAPRWAFLHTHFRRGYRFEPVVRVEKRRTGSRTGPRRGTASRSSP